ncbi:hypothetical protein WA171_002967, partial [Blastocystis sp. BT1]
SVNIETLNKPLKRSPSPTIPLNAIPEDNNRQRSLTETTRKMLMLGIEILAHHEKEIEGFEDYVSEGRTNRSCAGKTFNVIRWLIWIIAIVLNVVDPIISLYLGIRNISIGKVVVWLSLFALFFSIVFAFSVNVVLSAVCLVINLVLRIIAYQQRFGYGVFTGSRVFSIISFCSLGAVVLFEVIDETRNSCK